MRIAIIGGHGQIALALTRVLSERGDAVSSVIRNPAHAGDVEAVGGQPVVLDLEQQGRDELVSALSGVDAVVFAAGAGLEWTRAQVHRRSGWFGTARGCGGEGGGATVRADLDHECGQARRRWG